MTAMETTADDLSRRARDGDATALGALFALYHDRFRKMVSFRLDQRVAGRFDTSDVVQEADPAAAERWLPRSPEGLNQRAWLLVAGPPSQRDPKKGLELAREAVELAGDESN